MKMFDTSPRTLNGRGSSFCADECSDTSYCLGINDMKKPKVNNIW